VPTNPCCFKDFVNIQQVMAVWAAGNVGREKAERGEVGGSVFANAPLKGTEQALDFGRVGIDGGKAGAGFFDAAAGVLIEQALATAEHMAQRLPKRGQLGGLGVAGAHTSFYPLVQRVAGQGAKAAFMTGIFMSSNIRAGQEGEVGCAQWRRSKSSASWPFTATSTVSATAMRRSKASLRKLVVLSSTSRVQEIAAAAAGSMGKSSETKAPKTRRGGATHNFRRTNMGIKTGNAVQGCRLVHRQAAGAAWRRQALAEEELGEVCTCVKSVFYTRQNLPTSCCCFPYR